MKIGNNTTAPGMPSVGGTGTTSARPADAGRAADVGGTGKPAEGATTVALSNTAKSLMSADGSFDAQKVDRVRQSLSDGSFKVNAEAIADKLIANAQEVLGRSGRAG